MTYAVKEMFLTLQGEGAQTGRAAVFVRFSGCNLWSGREADRKTAICSFCDTDFIGTDGVGGGKFSSPSELAKAAANLWPERALGSSPMVVCTGGEPLLQLDPPLIQAFHESGFEVALETNGTLQAPAGVDWICVSPKSNAVLRQLSGDELKLVYPQENAPPERFANLAFKRFYLQPMDGPDLAKNTAAAAAYCMAHPKWRLSLQTHKLIGIP